MYPLAFVGVSGGFIVSDPGSEGAVAEIERFATLVLCTLITEAACFGKPTPEGAAVR